MALLKVKNLYFDDETGQLVADCACGARSVMGPILTDGRIPAGQAAVPEKIGSPLPPAGIANEGRIITHETVPHGQAPCGKTEVLMCVQNSDGDYEWTELAEST